MKITKLIFGKEYKEIHKWLDAKYMEYASKGYSYYHWSERHHLESIEKVFSKDTEEYKVACLHIMCDWLVHFKEVILPINKEETIKRLNMKLGVLNE